jgi:group I intron endonuclease
MLAQSAFPQNLFSDNETFMIIYLATNMVNGKKYVGKTSRPLARRWQLHKNAAIRGEGSYFQDAIRKHGAESFTVLPIWLAESKEELDEMEKRFISILGAQEFTVGYNCTAGGDGGATRSCRSQTVTERNKRRKQGLLFCEVVNVPSRRVRGVSSRNGKTFIASGVGSGNGIVKQMNLFMRDPCPKRATPGNQNALGKHWKLSAETRARMSAAWRRRSK